MLSIADVNVTKLAEAFPTELGHLAEDGGDQTLMRRLEIEGHYSAMVSKQESQVIDVRRSEAMQLPIDLPYHKWAPNGIPPNEITL